MSLRQLRVWLGEDARAVAERLRAGLGDRAARRLARAWLVRAFALAEPALPDPASSPRPSAAGAGASASREVSPGPSPAAVAEETERDGGEAAAAVAALRALDGLLLALSPHPRGALRPLREVWIRRPWPEHTRPPRAAMGTLRMAAAVRRRGALPMAINDARVAWFEARCASADPGILRPMRAPDGAKRGQGQRLLASELELIRKRGSSRFS